MKGRINGSIAYVYKLLKLEYFAFWQYNYRIDLNHIKIFTNLRVKYIHIISILSTMWFDISDKNGKLSALY